MTAVPVGPEPAAAFQRADALVELRRPAEAAALLRDALAAYPYRAELWGQLAMALLAAEQPAEALAAAGERVRLAPQSEWGHRLASLALSQLGRRSEATGAARESVRLAPREWRAHTRLARALADEWQLREAWRIALHAVQLAPHEPEAHMTVGSVAIAGKDWANADAAYRHVLALDPDNAAARNNLALVTLHRGGVADAAEGFADAVASGPRDDLPRRNLEVTLRVALGQLLRLQWCVAVLGWLGSSMAAGRPLALGVALGAVGAGLPILTVTATVRWRSLPSAVRRFAVTLLRTRGRFALLAGFAAGGYLALGATAWPLISGHPAVATQTTALALLCTAIGWYAGRR